MRTRAVFTMVIVAWALSAVPAVTLAQSEADRQRINNGEGCPGCDLTNANFKGAQMDNQDLTGTHLTGPECCAK